MTSGQETERVHSYNHGARTGLTNRATLKVKVKLTMLHKTAWVGAHLPLPGLEPVAGEPLMSVTCGQCDARPTVTFTATGTKLYCLVTEAHVLNCAILEKAKNETAIQADTKLILTIKISPVGD